MIQLTKKRKIILYSTLGVLLAIVIGFFIWALTPYSAQTKGLESAKTNPGLIYHETAETITMISSARQGSKGILFYPGGHIQSAAYVAPYADFIKESGIALVIVKPTLNLALFDLRSPDRYKRVLPIVKEWYIAGHSLGGVKACNVLSSTPQAYVGLILLGSYCTSRIDSELPVLSIGGSNDAITSSEKIKKYAKNLPSTTKFVEIKGMVHAQFGDYGDQPGDGDSTITQRNAWQDMQKALIDFID